MCFVISAGIGRSGTFVMVDSVLKEVCSPLAHAITAVHVKKLLWLKKNCILSCVPSDFRGG